jgi:4-hydroxy-L-threonine phosphate dehydrogenase PdxA
MASLPRIAVTMGDPAGVGAGDLLDGDLDKLEQLEQYGKPAEVMASPIVREAYLGIEASANA